MGEDNFMDVAANYKGKALGWLNEVGRLNADSESAYRICRKNNHLHIVERVWTATDNAIP